MASRNDSGGQAVIPAFERIAAGAFAVPELVCSHIAGRAVPEREGSKRIPVIYPATGEVVSELQQAEAQEVDAAVSAARDSFRTGVWRMMPVAERQRILRRIQALVKDHAAELAFLECLAAGLPMAHLQRRQVPRAAENFAFFADTIGQMAGESFEQEQGYLTIVTRQPAGVAALLAPWNAPLALASMQLASCLAFGNSCVLKPAEQTPLAIGRLVRLMEEAGLPPGVVNVVNGAGTVTGAELVAHPGIDRIAFTGGGLTAKHIMRAAAENLTPVHMELGGKSANMVFEDAELERAVDGSLLSIFSNSGQICIAGSRILVQRGVSERFTEAFVRRARNIRVGDPMDPGSEMGPLAFRAHYQAVLDHISRALADGAELLAGGHAIDALAPGHFVAPTVLRVASNDLPICQGEVFGPVVTIQEFESEEEAFALANDSDFGLVSYLWTQSLQRSLRAQQRIDAGTVWVNTPMIRDLRAPFGGFKQSGIGRDGPRQSADFFTEEKATIVSRESSALLAMGRAES